MRKREVLENALAKQDADGVENVLSEEITREDDCVPVLAKLLTCDWHESHEDITLTLQQLKDPRAVETLQQVAGMKFDYLRYNDSQALARKCTWALADIGTPEAKTALQSIAQWPDSVVAGYARKRLDRWDQELPRKGSLPTERDAMLEAYNRIPSMRAAAMTSDDQILQWLKAVDGSGREARDRALEEMRTAGLDRVIPLLAAKLNDPDTEIRGEAVTALCLLDAERAVELVLPLLQDPTIEIRWHTSGCLHDFGDERAVEPLLAVLQNDPDPMVRNTAAWALGAIGSPAAIPALIKAMDEDHEVDELGYTTSSSAATALDDILGTEETRLKLSDSLRQMKPDPPDLDRLRELATELYERWSSEKN